MHKTILITDDALIMRELIKDAVIAAGWTVVGTAANGQQAVELYRQHRPAVMTLDMVMPEFDGLYALKGIHEFDPQARILLVSALDQSQILKDAFALGASDFIIKPFQGPALVEAIENLLQSQPAVA